MYPIVIALCNDDYLYSFLFVVDILKPPIIFSYIYK
jgi:hypothetical protein